MKNTLYVLMIFLMAPWCMSCMPADAVSDNETSHPLNRDIRELEEQVARLEEQVVRLCMFYELQGFPGIDLQMSSGPFIDGNEEVGMVYATATVSVNGTWTVQLLEHFGHEPDGFSVHSETTFMVRDGEEASIREADSWGPVTAPYYSARLYLDDALVRVVAPIKNPYWKGES